MSDLPNGDSIDLSSLVSKLNELRDFTTFITTGVFPYYAPQYQSSEGDFVNASAKELYDDLYDQQLAESSRSEQEKEIIRDLLRFLIHGEDGLQHPEYIEYYKCLLQKKLIKFYIQEYQKLIVDGQKGKVTLNGDGREQTSLNRLQEHYRGLECPTPTALRRRTSSAAASADSGESKQGGRRKRKPIKINRKMKGVFTRKAKRKGMSVQKYARYVIKKYKGKTKNKKQLKLLRQAVFAKTAKKWKKRRRKSKRRKK